MLTLTLTLPDKCLSPNARVYFLKRAKAVKAARLEAKLTAISVMNEMGIEPPRWERATAKMRFYFPMKRRHDSDNLIGSTKAQRDGLTDAGVWADDQHITHLPIEIHIDKARPRLELEIEESK